MRRAEGDSLRNPARLRMREPGRLCYKDVMGEGTRRPKGATA